jgi:hypothetical protein
MHSPWRWAGSLVLVAALTAARADDPKPKGEPPKPEPPRSAAEQYQALVKEYDDAMQKFFDEYRAAKTDAERQKAFKSQPDSAVFAKKFLAVAKESPKDPAAVDALAWVVSHAGYTAEGPRALELLARDYVTSDKIGPICANVAHLRAPQVEPFLRDVIAKNPDHAVQGQACFALGKYLKNQAELVHRLKEDGGLVERLGAMAEFGPERAKKLLALDPAALANEAEGLFERVVKDFADVKQHDRPLDQAAQGELFEMRNLAVGKVAPEIEGEDIDGVKFKLSDYRGKVILLDFWGNW